MIESYHSHNIPNSLPDDMPDAQMESSHIALGRLEEQQPFLDIGVDDTESYLSYPKEKRNHSYLYSVIFFLLGSTFMVSAMWYEIPEYQCIRQLNVWCK
jgi:hypothetical protein